MKFDDRIDPTGDIPRPASPYDTLDAEGLMSEVLHINDSRTLAAYIRDGLPTHRIGRGIRLFIRGEVLDWLRARCITPAPDQTTDQTTDEAAS